MCMLQLSMSQAAGGGENAIVDTIRFWDGQVTYTEQSSTLDKQLRSLTTGSSLLTTYVRMPCWIHP